MPGLSGNERLDSIEQFVDNWLADQLAQNATVAGVDKVPEGQRSWFVRLNGKSKDSFTVRFQLRQRTLHYETFVMPAPAENQGLLYAHLLRRNLKLFGASFAIGDEDAIFLQGAIHNDLVTADDELDRVLGSLYSWVEDFFPAMIRIGFASKFD